MPNFENPVTAALEAANRHDGGAVRAALTLGAALLFAGTLSAQSTRRDLSGFWEPKYTGGSGAFIDVFGKVDPAPVVAGLTPMRRPRGEHPAYGAKDPVDGSACRVLAFPFFMTSSPPFDILQREDEILIISEREGGSRHVYMDGRSHPADVEHTSNGHSIGHWEGDTLVIDTIGFLGFAGVPGGGRRGPNTHLVERYHAATPLRGHFTGMVREMQAQSRAGHFAAACSFCIAQDAGSLPQRAAAQTERASSTGEIRQSTCESVAR